MQPFCIVKKIIMPANLNALIRYKTINNCLSGGKRRWSVEELMEACSKALSESRGRYESISERTLRDDLRIMRSDILGFNAPIKQQDGLYFYSDPGYSIMTISISDSQILEQLIRLLTDLKKNVKHPELEIVLKKLINLNGGGMIEVAEEVMQKRRSVIRRESRKPDKQASAPAEPGEAHKLYDSVMEFYNEVLFPKKIMSGQIFWKDILSVIK